MPSRSKRRAAALAARAAAITACASASTCSAFSPSWPCRSSTSMRFDIPRQRFYFAGYELWINEFGIVFFALMFLMFVVVAVVGVLRPRLLRLSVPADDLQRSLDGAGGLAAPQDQQACCAVRRRHYARIVAPRSTWCSAALRSSWRLSSSPISSSRATCCSRLAGARCAHGRRHRRRRRHAHHVPRFRPGPAALLHHRLPLRLSARHARRRSHPAGHLSRRGARVHRVQEMRARLPHGHRYPQIALSDRVRALRRVHRRLRRCAAAHRHAGA